MRIPRYTKAQIPTAPRAITKGLNLKDLLGEKAIAYLGRNIELVDASFPVNAFYQLAYEGIDSLSLMKRAEHIAKALRQTLPVTYQDAISVLVESLTDANDDTEEFGLASMFFLPYSSFIAQFGIDPKFNDQRDPFDASMDAMIALTKRFTSEFAIRPFLIADLPRTLNKVESWLNHRSNHVRRFCSEGTRPKLPWGKNIPALINDPTPILPLLYELKDDPSLYVRRSVANSLGDIAKDHPDLVFSICYEWLEDADNDVRWLIRHAVRYHAKRHHPKALAIREAAKTRS